MTKGGVAAGKIESWLQKFESCSPKVRKKSHARNNWPRFRLQAPDMSFEIQHLLWI